MPSDFLKTIVNSVQIDLRQILNSSLQSGTFPKSLKVAAIKPLLKENAGCFHVNQLQTYLKSSFYSQDR